MVVKAKPKIAKASEAAKKSGDTNLAITVMVGVAAVAAGGYFFFMRSKVVALSPSDSAKLKSVFYSGEPWLVECTKTKNASPMVYAAESLLKGVQIGTLDCSAPLPSGKTTFEKFKINPPSYGPVLLAAANTERPQLVPRNTLTDKDLAPWVKGATKAKLYQPSSGTQFDSQCVRKPWCLVVLTASGRLADAERGALQSLAEKERRLRIVKVDASKSNLLIDLPGGALPVPTGSKATLVLLKETGEAKAADGEGEEGGSSQRAVIATHLPAGLSDPADTRSTILAALSSAEPIPVGFSELQKRPALRPKRVPVPPSTPSTTPSSTPSKSEPASKTLTDAELKALREERQRVIKEAEMQRRAQMAEEEASAANIVEETTGEEGTYASAFAEEDGEEAAEEEEAEAEAMDFD